MRILVGRKYPIPVCSSIETKGIESNGLARQVVCRLGLGRHLFP